MGGGPCLAGLIFSLVGLEEAGGSAGEPYVVRPAGDSSC